MHLMRGHKNALTAKHYKVAVLYLEGTITEEDGDGIVGKEVVKTLKKIEHFLHLELFLFLEDFGLLLGGLHHLLIFSRQHITEH